MVSIQAFESAASGEQGKVMEVPVLSILFIVYHPQY